MTTPIYEPREADDNSPNFLGFEGRNCGDHRTVGSHRAWCFDCTMWCYPSNPCNGCEVPSLETDVQNLEDILGNVWLYIDWRYVTKQLTTEQKERFADAVDAWSQRLNDDDGRSVTDRWWRDA